MNTYTAKLESVSPYSSSRFHAVPKLDRETADDHEKRTWINKLTTDSKGRIVIRGAALKFALDTAAKQLGKQVPGKGKRTYTAIFKAGVLVTDDLTLGLTIEEAPQSKRFAGVWVHVNADGVRGSGKRVMRCFPTVLEWSASVSIVVLDDAITKDILHEHLVRAGAFVGLGQYRPENGGTNGRFKVVSLN